MPASQPDLFGTPAPVRELPSEEIQAVFRKRLRELLALVQGAETMPWATLNDIIREDNYFRAHKDLLPPAEGTALWAAFDVEMDRLYAIMNQGTELDPLYDPSKDWPSKD